MSNFLAIATVTATLGRILQAAVGADVPGALVTAVRPDGPNSGVPDTGVNLFLYQVTPNAQWRNQDLPTRRADGTVAQRPQAALDLHYLLSFYGAEIELEPQRLLGSTLRTLHARPLLDRAAVVNAIAANAFLAGSDLADAVESVRFTPMSLNLEELSKLWSVFFQTTYVLSVAYRASVVLLTAEAQPLLAQPVAERVVRALPTLDLGGVQAAEPASLEGLTLWLRADAGISHDGQGRVARWTDQSGRDNDAFQIDDARKPQFVRDGLNRKPILRFDGADDRLAIDALHYDALGQIEGLTLFVLVKSAATSDQILLSFDRNEYWRFSLRSGAGGVGWHTRGAGGGVDDLTTATPVTDARWHVISCRFAAGEAPDKPIHVDGEEVAATAAHGGAGLGSGAIRFGYIGVGSEAGVVNGNLGPNQFLAGDLAEVILFGRALSDLERRQIERYLIEKYNTPSP
jgi:hypothetical protein